MKPRPVIGTPGGAVLCGSETLKATAPAAVSATSHGWSTARHRSRQASGAFSENCPGRNLLYGFAAAHVRVPTSHAAELHAGVRHTSKRHALRATSQTPFRHPLVLWQSLSLVQLPASGA